MYLLRDLTEKERISRDVAELKRLSSQVLREATEMAKAHERVLEEVKLKSADHGYADGNDLSANVKVMRGELLSGTGRFYAENLYGKELSAEQRHDVARAIVLTRSSWVARSSMDPISKSLTRRALLDCPGLSGKWTAFDVDGRISVSVDTVIERSELFGSGGRKTVDGLTFEAHPVTVRTEKGTITLDLLVEYGNRSFRWVTRGKSKLSASARKLVRELNRISEDQRQRTDWAQDYQKATPLLGLTAAQQEELRAEFGRWNGSMPKTLPGARPGVHLEDWFANRSGTQVYPVRCESCSRVAAYEIVYCVGELIAQSEFRKAESKHIRHREDVEHSVNSMLKKFHRSAGCYSVHGTSFRTGELVCTDDIGRLVD